MSAGTTYATIIATYADRPVLAYDGNVFWNARGLRYAKERPPAFSRPQYVRTGSGDAR
jgi:hypothetical protein